MKVSSGLIMLVCYALFVSSCSGGKEGVPGYSTIALTPDTLKQVVDLGTMEVGKTKTIAIKVNNTGKEKDLHITEVKWEYEPVTDEEKADPQGPAFILVSPQSGQSQITVAPLGFPREGVPDEIWIQVKVKRYNDDVVRKASLTLVNDNTKDYNKRNLTIQFQTQLCKTALKTPDNIDFGPVHKGEVAEKGVELLNPSTCDILIDWFIFEGDKHFSLLIEDKEYSVDKSKDKVVLEEPYKIGANSTGIWKVKFAPETGDPASATLIVHAIGDENAPDGRKIPILANTSGPKIKVEPVPVDFGGRLIGKTAKIDMAIKSVGTDTLIITDIKIKEGSSPDFALSFDDLPGGNKPTKENPLKLEVNQVATLGMLFTPDVKNPIDPVTNKPSPDKGWVVISNNTFDAELEIEMSGFGVEVECPTPVIIIEEGEEVPPQTILHLKGDQSVPSSGQIVSYQWTVNQPPDNKFNLLPSSNFANPKHEVNIAGEYTYCLDVCDTSYCSNDPKCLTTVCKKVIVIPKDAIHVELTWDTPGDLNQFDEGPDAGSDMDLHFVHPFATGPDLDGDGKPDGWFDIPYDCFWFNPNPEWESMNPNIDDNPSLDRDDTDGAGPENINLDVPVSGRVYRVGVHYWDDHGYGISYPTVKIYIWGQLVFNKNLKDLGVKMMKCDMWDVATIEWPSGKVTGVTNPDGSLKITHNYAHPAFVQIGGGTCGTGQ